MIIPPLSEAEELLALRNHTLRQSDPRYNVWLIYNQHDEALDETFSAGEVWLYVLRDVVHTLNSNAIARALFEYYTLTDPATRTKLKASMNHHKLNYDMEYLESLIPKLCLRLYNEQCLPDNWKQLYRETLAQPDGGYSFHYQLFKLIEAHEEQEKIEP